MGRGSATQLGTQVGEHLIIECKDAKLFLNNAWTPKGFFIFESIINALVSPFLIHLNTYVMSLRPL